MAQNAFELFEQRKQMIATQTSADEPPPVPDFIITVSRFIVYGLIFSICGLSTFYILAIGMHLRPLYQAHAHYSYAVGVFGFGIFDIIKCALSTLVLLSREESCRRMATKEARRQRMELKGQSVEETDYRNLKWNLAWIGVGDEEKLKPDVSKRRRSIEC